jgi:glycosyltransferase involved in cell wall biosynthesis
MNSQSFLISVIIPVFNPNRYIIEAIETIYNQTISHLVKIEIIVIDDFSNTDQKEYIYNQLQEKYESIKIIYLYKNTGPSKARNIGIKQASGDIIAFLDYDDLWPSNKLELQLKFLKENPLVQVVSGGIKYFSTENIPLPDIVFNENGSIFHVHMGAVIARKEVFVNDNIYFDEALRLSEDWDWWLKIKEKGVPFVILPQDTLLYRIHANNSSTKKTLKELGILSILKNSIKRRQDYGRDILEQHVKSNENYKVSVVIPLYNGEAFIQYAINSVLAQSYTVDEIIVVDDGSIDNGPAIIRELFPEIVFIQQENKGVANARNIGWKKAVHNWIAFLDQDDIWHSKKLEKQIEVAKKNSSLNFIACLQKNIITNKATIPVNYRINDEIQICNVPSGWLVKKIVLESLNGFKEYYVNGSDTDFITRYRERKMNEFYIQEVLVDKVIHGKNESMNIKTSAKELLQIIKEKLQRNG